MIKLVYHGVLWITATNFMTTQLHQKIIDNALSARDERAA